MIKSFGFQTDQNGSALIVSMILLVVMTLLAVASMRVTTLQEKMSGNMRDYDLAFQAAEAGLRAGELYLQGATVGPFNGSSGLFPYRHDDIPTIADPLSVWAEESRAFGATLSNVASQPLFIIEELPAVPNPGNSLEAGVVIEESGMYRVTSRGEGGTASAVSIIQSTFKR